MKIYNYLYKKNIEKYLKLHKKEFAILGHLHEPQLQKNFRVVGTFHNGYFYENENMIILSDVHLGLYEYNISELKKLKLFLSEKNKKIIILGDFFDLYYSKPAELINKFSDFIKIIKKQIEKSNLIYIYGNHDWNITSLLNIPSVSNYSINNMILFHGHICDPYHTLFPFNLIEKIRNKLGYKLHFLKAIYLKFN